LDTIEENEVYAYHSFRAKPEQNNETSLKNSTKSSAISEGQKSKIQKPDSEKVEIAQETKSTPNVFKNGENATGDKLTPPSDTHTQHVNLLQSK